MSKLANNRAHGRALRNSGSRTCGSSGSLAAECGLVQPPEWDISCLLLLPCHRWWHLILRCRCLWTFVLSPRPVDLIISIPTLATYLPRHPFRGTPTDSVHSPQLASTAPVNPDPYHQTFLSFQHFIGSSFWISCLDTKAAWCRILVTVARTLTQRRKPARRHHNGSRYPLRRHGGSRLCDNGLRRRKVLRRQPLPARHAMLLSCVFSHPLMARC
jgi:hypothetical protein